MNTEIESYNWLGAMRHTFENGQLTFGPGAFSIDKKIGSDLDGEGHEIERVVFEGNSTTRIYQDAFFNCKSLLLIDGLDRQPLIEIGQYAFAECYSLVAFQFPETLKRIERHAFDSCISLSGVQFKEGLEEIGSYAFNDCRALGWSIYDKQNGRRGTLHLPSTLKKINSCAFWGCLSLDVIEVPKDCFVDGAVGAHNGVMEFLKIGYTYRTEGDGFDEIPTNFSSPIWVKIKRY